MPLYATADQLYACIGTLFNRVLEESPDVEQAILASGMVIRMRCTAPMAEFTLNGRRSPVQTNYGPSSLRPDLDVELAADTLHRILMDELSTQKAAASKLLKVKGQVWKISTLADLLTQGQAFYRQVLREHGLAP